MENNILINDRTYWVGYVDDRKVPFHRLTLEKGTTYNSYFLNTAKPTIIDTVDSAFGREYVKNLEQVLDFEKLSYVVINHVEPDHAGALPALISKAKKATIVTTEKAKEFLIGMFKLKGREFLVVRDGDTLDIGGKTLQFFETPYLHTEETMITYCIEDKTLFPCDIFSTHVANYTLFNDLASEDITADFKGYYSLIMNPHRPFVRDMLEKIKNLEIEMIAPSHGYILRSDAQKFIKLYDEMSSKKINETDEKAVILFSSMTGNTAKVAQYISQGLTAKGMETAVINIKNSDTEAIIDFVKEAKLLVIGSSTKYGDMIGNLEDILKEIAKLDLSGKIGASFGSFGWSGEAIEVINDYLKQTTINLIDSSFVIKATGDNSIKFPLRVRFAPEEEIEKLCINAGKMLGEFVLR